MNTADRHRATTPGYRMRLATIAALLCSAGVVRASGQESEEKPTSLTLTLETRAEKILPSQSLPLIVRLVNRTSSNIEAERALSLWFDSGLRVYAAREGGEFARYRHVQASGCGAGRKRTYRPGEGESAQVVLSQSGESGPAGVFAKPGKYRIRVEYVIGFNKYVESPEIEITVSEPSGKEFLAAQFLRDKGLVNTLGCEAERYGGKWAVPALEEFLSKHGETAYAPEATLALAICLWNQLPNGWRGNERDAELSRIWSVLDGRFDACSPSLLPDTLYWGIKTGHFLGDHAYAQTLLSKFKRECAWHPRYSELEQLEEWVDRIKPKSDK